MPEAGPPTDRDDEIRASNERRGFGSVRVHATIGSSEWDTSVFPDTKTGSFPLPVKAAVRRKETIDAGDALAVTIAAN